MSGKINRRPICFQGWDRCFSTYTCLQLLEVVTHTGLQMYLTYIILWNKLKSTSSRILSSLQLLEFKNSGNYFLKCNNWYFHAGYATEISVGTYHKLHGHKFSSQSKWDGLNGRATALCLFNLISYNFKVLFIWNYHFNYHLNSHEK